MSSLPTDGHMSNGSRTQGEFKIDIEAMRDVIGETPGGEPRQQITIDGSGQITPVVGYASYSLIVNSGVADDLGKIIPTNCRDGYRISLKADDPNELITVKNMVGGDYQISLLGGRDFVLGGDGNTELTLEYVTASTLWREVSSGSVRAETVRLPGFLPAETVTIASDVLNVTQAMTVAAAQSSTSDNIQEIICADTLGLRIILVRPDAGDIITIKNNTGSGGKIYTRTGTDFALAGSQYALFEMRGVDAYEIERFGFARTDIAGRVGCRLTASSGNPVPTGDVSSTNSLYIAPDPRAGNMLPDLNASTNIVTWRTFSQITLSLSGVSSGSMYDVFVNWNGSAWVASYLVWTNVTTRATALAQSAYHGFLVKSGAQDYLYVGSFRASGSGVTKDIRAGQRYVYSHFNQVEREVEAHDPTDYWTVNTSGAFRELNGGSTEGTSRVGIVRGWNDKLVKATGILGAQGSPAYLYLGIGVDSSTVNSGNVNNGFVSPPNETSLVCEYNGCPGVGFRTLRLLENSSASTNFYSDNNLPGTMRSGLVAKVWM